MNRTALVALLVSLSLALAMLSVVAQVSGSALGALECGVLAGACAVSSLAAQLSR
jgi:hypothetical protein